MSKIKRVGIITTSFQLMNENIEETAEVFSFIKFVSMHTESLFHIGCIKNYGYSPLFREISEGEMAPEYKIQVSKEDGKISKIKVIEEKN